MLKGLFIMREKFVNEVYPEKVKAEIKSLVDIISRPLSAEDVEKNPSLLKDVDVIFSGWGGLKLTKEMIEAAPDLKVVFHAAGTIKLIVSDEFWKNDIAITTASFANGIPVTEFTLSQILFSLKSGWYLSRELKKTKQFPPKPIHRIAGAYGSTVGLISLSTIGKEVAKVLKQFDIKVLAYDPFASEEIANELNVERCSLTDVFKRSDVVSLHAPLLPETIGLIKREHFMTMKEHATFINTARGKIVKEGELIEVLQKRKDLTAILDVTDPEPPVENSPLYDLENVVLTPHIAGSEGPECGRMGALMLSELKRYLAGEELKWQVSETQFKTMA